MRRCAQLLKIHPITVSRKLRFLAQQARIDQARFLERLRQKKIQFRKIQFDELETLEHTKCKPLSVALMVEESGRKILGFEVSSMPAKGLLVKKALLKYGYRKDDRGKGLYSLFHQTRSIISEEAVFTSDECPRYPSVVRNIFPRSTHKTVKARRGCIVGQGELKKIGFDPLFSLNHTCAMLRANINRLFRRTWCTTKKRECLYDHISLYVSYHNKVLT